MKKYQVYIIKDAELDLIEIYEYVSRTDSIAKAENLIEKLEKLCYSLEFFLKRGHIPPELELVAITEYREIHFKPYRVIYQLVNDKVYIHGILDGRRALEQILLQRLLRS